MDDIVILGLLLVFLLIVSSFSFSLFRSMLLLATTPQLETGCRKALDTGNLPQSLKNELEGFVKEIEQSKVNPLSRPLTHALSLSQASTIFLNLFPWTTGGTEEQGGSGSDSW